MVEVETDNFDFTAKRAASPSGLAHGCHLLRDALLIHRPVRGAGALGVFGIVLHSLCMTEALTRKHLLPVRLSPPPCVCHLRLAVLRVFPTLGMTCARLGLALILMRQVVLATLVALFV